MDPLTSSRRTFLLGALGLPFAGALAACGSSGPTSTSPGGAAGGAGATGAGASFWTLNGPPQEAIRQGSVDAFNAANPDRKIAVTMFQNDAYKQKIKTALGAGQAPTILWGWGGGGLASWVDAGQVDDLTPWFTENPDVKEKFFPATFAAATVKDKIYAVPCESVTPIVFFYSTAALEKVGAQPPQTWGEILDLVPRLNDKGIAPFSLGGQSRWTNMMWLEFLFDRIGGPEIFQAVYAGEKGAWSNPLALQALGEVQKLVKAGGFVKGFSSVTADSQADLALLTSGKAAMMLHGAWTYGMMKGTAQKFVTDGTLGFANFPAVDGGTGDPSNTYGNPAQYLSLSSKATDAEKKTALDYFKTGVLATDEQQKWIENGQIPVVKGSDALIGDSPDAAWLKFVYDLSLNAKTFSQSWDQALSPAQAEVLLDNIAKLFQLSVSPQQFADNLNAVIGQ